MDELSSYEKELKFLNKLVSLCINSISYYSKFLFTNMNTYWDIYINEENSGKKRNIALEKLEKSIDKLKDKVYGDVGNLNKLLLKINDEISSNYENDKEKKNLCHEIDECINERDILIYFISLYKKIELKKNKILNKKRIDTENNLEVGDIPTIKRTYCDSDGHWYANISIKNNNIVIDKKRFEKEVLLYNKCLEDGNLVFVDYVINKKKMSPYEKRRRNYIKSMFELEKRILELKDKKIDMIYPLDKVYGCAKDIVDNLYKELFDYVEEKDILDSLKLMTIEAYGCERKLKIYNEIIENFNKIYNQVNDDIKEELYNYAISLKEGKDYNCFKKIEGVVPLVSDLYSLLSEKIIRNININFNFYKKNMRNLIIKTCNYMSIDDLVKFYYEFKSNLLNRKINNVNNLTNDYVILQKTICELISKINNLDIRAIPKMYLKEDIYF